MKLIHPTGKTAVVMALSVLLLAVVAPSALGAGIFSDVDDTHPFVQEIEELAGKYIIGGYPDGTFMPDAFVTRAQFAKIIVLATDKHTAAVDNASSPTFSDVATEMGNPYPFDYIEEAAGAGYVQGSNGLFRPYDNITRAQLALILARAGGSNLADPPVEYDTGFTDVPEYAAAEVAKAKFNGLLDGKSPTTFDPYSNATRGQTAKMVSRLLAKIPLPQGQRGVEFYGFNVNHPPLDQVEVRQALALAIDRQAIVDSLDRTDALPATGLVPPGMPGFDIINQDFLKSTAQVEQAKTLLADAGYANGAGLPEIVISHNTSEAHAAIASAIKEQWAAIGVNSTIVEIEWDEYLDFLASGNVMVYRLGWNPDFGDAYNVLEIFRGGGDNNFTQWANAAYDQGLVDSLLPMSDAERWAAYGALEKILTVDEMPVMPIYWYGP